LQLEWHRNGWDLEIEIEGPGQLYAYARELATDQEWEADLGSVPNKGIPREVIS